MQRRISVLFLMVALVAMLLTGCSTITETVGQAVSDQVASVLPTLAASAALPTSDAVIQPASQTNPTADVYKRQSQQPLTTALPLKMRKARLTPASGDLFRSTAPCQP